MRNIESECFMACFMFLMYMAVEISRKEVGGKKKREYDQDVRTAYARPVLSFIV